MRSRLYVLWSPPRAVALHVGFCILPHLRCVSSDKSIRPDLRPDGAQIPMWSHMGHPTGRHCSQAGSEIRRDAEPHVVTHGAPDRPTLLSGRVGDPAGRRTPCGHTWGARQADTAIALRRCAGYFYGFCKNRSPALFWRIIFAVSNLLANASWRQPPSETGRVQ